MVFRRRRPSTRRPLRRRPVSTRRRTGMRHKTALVPRPRSFAPFPPKMFATLKYNELIQFDPTALADTNYVFCANSIYDPNVTGTGHQPMGHDIYEQLYNHYRVLSSTIKITVVPNETSIAGAAVCGIQLSDDGVGPTAINTMIEERNARYRYITYNSVNTVKHYFNVHKVYPYNFQATTAQFGSNPGEMHYFIVFVGPIFPGTLNPGNFSVNVEIKYNCMFWENKDLGES